MLAADEIALYADCAWWQCRVDREIELRQRAFNAFVADHQPARAAYAAWMLSVRYSLRGDSAASSGWLQRAQRQLAGQPECVQHGYVACNEVEQALRLGDLPLAEAHAARAVALGHRFDDPDLIALAVAWQGQCLLAGEQVEAGTRLLDEAMTRVTAGELNPLFTGWVYCFVTGCAWESPTWPGPAAGPGRRTTGPRRCPRPPPTAGCAGYGWWRS